MMVRKIMVVDDHEVVREGLRETFAACIDIRIEREASTGAEAMHHVQATNLDGVLLDLSLPDRSGIAVLRRVRAERPSLPILVFSMHGEDQYAFNVIKAGARGYISKSRPAAEFVDAMRAVLRGDRWVSAAVASQLAVAQERAAGLHERLSTREFEVFCKLAEGGSVSNIAGELFVSVKTICTHRTNVLGKMGLRTNSDLTYYAIKNALIE